MGAEAVSERAGWEMAALIEAKDWSATPLGARESWPTALRVLVETILAQPTPMIVLWGEKLVQVYNDGYRMVAGKKHPRALGQPTMECWPEVAGMMGEIYPRVLAGEAVSLVDQQFVLERSGAPEELYLTVVFSPVRDDAGERAGVLAVVSDTTARVRESRQRLEREAREDRLAERHRLALEAADLGDWEWEQETDLMTLSARAAEIFGVSREERLTRAAMREFIEPGYRERARDASAQATETGRDYDMEYPVVRRDGRRVWVAARGRGLYDAGGRLTRMLGVLQDITARKEAEVERERLLERERAARSEAERANRMKDEFLATLSHELRTPLNAIVGWSQILRQSGARHPHSAEDLEEGLETIERNARAQAQIIEDLLDMSRIVSGKVRLNVKRVELAEVIRASIETVRPAAEAKGIRLAAKIAPEASHVMADGGRLQQVFWNLLSNAVKFTPKGGSVEVSLACVESQVEVAVTDTGAGIAPAFLPHVFDRFRQADASITRQHGGLGLGLAIVKNLVELHGGTIRAESAGEGRGARFTVRLPVAAVQTESAEAPARTWPGEIAAMCDGAVDIAGVRVLVVDDEPDARNLVKRLLEECKAVAETASSAEDAIRRLRQADGVGFDVLVSDVGMPGEDGYGLLRRVRALPEAEGGSIPAVALTAYARTEDRAQALGAGFQVHLAKPVEPAKLVAAVAKLAKRG